MLKLAFVCWVDLNKAVDSNYKIEIVLHEIVTRLVPTSTFIPVLTSFDLTLHFGQDRFNFFSDLNLKITCTINMILGEQQQNNCTRQVTHEDRLFTVNQRRNLCCNYFQKYIVGTFWRLFAAWFDRAIQNFCDALDSQVGLKCQIRARYSGKLNFFIGVPTTCVGDTVRQRACLCNS